MEKEITYKDAVDYPATLMPLNVGEYVMIPTSERDISAIRTAVAKFQKTVTDRTFSVHKTVNGARVQRNS